MIVKRRGVSFEAEDHPHWERTTWEDYTYRWLERLLTPETDFIDVGAWIGSFSLWGSSLARRVLALEPDPIAHSMLMRSIDRANDEAWNIAAPRGLAVWSEVGARELHAGPGDHWGKSRSSLRQPHSKRSSVRVSTVRLQTLPAMFDLREPLVVKMDTEGAEGAILSGSIEWILETHPSLLVAPHDRMYPDDLLREVVPELVATYKHAVDSEGKALEWPTDGPEPRMMIFTDLDVG